LRYCCAIHKLGSLNISPDFTLPARAGDTTDAHEPDGREANGLDLSGAVIIMDYIAIKNFRYMQIAFNSHASDITDIRQGYLNLC
jgi:hypothetical protein